MHGSNSTTDPSDQIVLDALERVLNSQSFARTQRLQTLLNHIVRETLAGRSDQLLAKNIASDLFDIDVDEDPDLSRVRVEIGRLRSRLQYYYDSEGHDAEIVIDIPKGSYHATFAPAQGAARRSDGGLGALPVFLRRLTRRTALVAAGLVAAVAVLVASAVVLRPQADGGAQVLPRIAVQDIVSAPGGTDFLADGLTADLVNRLARFNHLVVVSRGATDMAERTTTAGDSLGARLDADYVLSGLLQTASDGERLTLQLLSVPTGDVHWVHDFMLPESGQDLIQAQLDVANAVAVALAGRAGVVTRLEATVSDRAADRTSYLCVLRYYTYLNRRAADEHAGVRDCLEAAVIETPGYSEAWSALAQIYLDEARNGYAPSDRPGTPIERAHEAALTAVEVAPHSASAQSVLAATEYFRRDIPAFRATARRALELNPNDPDALAYFGHFLAMSGDWSAGKSHVERARELSPVHPPLWHHTLAMIALIEEDYDRARREAVEGEMPPFYMSYVLLAAINGHLGNAEAAAAAVGKLEELRPGYLDAVETDMQRRNFQPELVASFRAGLDKAYAMAGAL